MIFIKVYTDIYAHDNTWRVDFNRTDLNVPFPKALKGEMYIVRAIRSF
jgi:hypothetical protein